MDKMKLKFENGQRVNNGELQLLLQYAWSSIEIMDDLEKTTLYNFLRKINENIRTKDISIDNVTCDLMNDLDNLEMKDD